MDKSTRQILGIILNLFFPGIGNILVGQTRKGIAILITTILVTPFYFLPLLGFFIENSDVQAIFFLITIFLAVVLFIVDLGLMIYSIIMIVQDKD